MRQAIKRFLSVLPFKRRLLQAAAFLHPRLKSELGLHTINIIRAAHAQDKADVFTTNLGLSHNYRILLPSSASSVYLFGRAEHYYGERGALFLAQFLAPDCNAFVDIGAHSGYYLFFLRNGLTNNLPIYYFEPNKELYDLIERNLRANGLRGIKGYQAAVGAFSGRSKFFVNLSDSFSSSLTPMVSERRRLKEIPVDIYSFDSIVEEHGLENLLVKVDVENAEFEFLRGATVHAGEISYLIMEVLGDAFAKEFIASITSKFEMQAYYINDYRLEHSPDGKCSWAPGEYNWLFCRLDPDELASRLNCSPFSVVA